MENNETKLENEVVDTGTNPETETNTGSETTETEQQADTITLTQEDLNKRIQSAEDKLRTKYSKQIKELEKQIADSKPVEKSEQEKDYEERLAKLEEREKAIALNDALSAKGIDKGLAQFLRSDVDVDALSSFIDTLVTTRNKQNSYVPTGHKSGETMTKDEFRRLGMDAKERLFAENPELYRSLVK